MGEGESDGHRVLIVVLVVATAVLALAAGGLSLVLTGVLAAPGSVDASDRGGSGGPSTPSPTPKPTPKPTPTRSPAAPVLDELSEPAASELPTSRGLEQALARVLDDPALGQRIGLAVRDLSTGKLLYGERNGTPFVPASTTKLVSGAAALAVLGPEHRFQTSVVQGSRPSEIVLVGGGDPLLATARAWERRGAAAHDRTYPAPSTIDQLAKRTAERLLADGTKRVTVRLDDSLFAEAESPKWEPQYVGSVASPVSALWVDEGRLNWPYDIPRADDPAMLATKEFVRALDAAGVRVFGQLSRGRAPESADQLAAVSSPPLGEIVEHTLMISDNDAAEVIARHVAIAQGKPATFAGTTDAISEVLHPYGVAIDEIELYDGSGLSRHNALTPNVLTQVLAAAAGPENPELRPLLTGLPVAAFNGSLGERFDVDGSAESGRGLVRAKTGTLTGVSSLAGTVTTKDGHVLAFAVITDRLTAWAEPALDAVAAELATCGCR